MATKQADITERLPKGKPIPVRACLLAERLHVRGLYEPPMALGPGAVSLGAGRRKRRSSSLREDA
jgi:hypothetical protein